MNEKLKQLRELNERIRKDAVTSNALVIELLTEAGITHAPGFCHIGGGLDVDAVERLLQEKGR